MPKRIRKRRTGHPCDASLGKSVVKSERRIHHGQCRPPSIRRPFERQNAQVSSQPRRDRLFELWRDHHTVELIVAKLGQQS